MLKGSISFVNRSDTGHKGGIWEASVFHGGRRFRKRSSHREECEKWLEDMNTHIGHRVYRRPVRVVEDGDPRFLIRYGNKAMTMEQREERLRRLTCEANLTLEYWKTRDLAAIARHVEKVIMPELVLYLQNSTTHYRILFRDRKNVIYNALSIFYCHLYADRPIFNYGLFIKKCIRLYAIHGNFFYYDGIPEPVHRIVENVDYSILATKFVVKPQKHNN